MSVSYPQTPIEWIDWISKRLEIDEVQGRSLAESGAFPFNLLVRAWEMEFDERHGFHPNFIPALTRNKIGFVKWVYCNDPEPNWMKSDDR